MLDNIAIIAAVVVLVIWALWNAIEPTPLNDTDRARDNEAREE